MRGAVLYGPRDIRFEDRPESKIIKPTDTIIRMAATCVCGYDLWPCRGIEASAEATLVRVPLADGTLMLRNGGGVIVNTSSSAGVKGFKGQAAYAAAYVVGH